jgi:hypothetical protein
MINTSASNKLLAFLFSNLNAEMKYGEVPACFSTSESWQYTHQKRDIHEAAGRTGAIFRKRKNRHFHKGDGRYPQILRHISRLI